MKMSLMTKISTSVANLKSYSKEIKTKRDGPWMRLKFQAKTDKREWMVAHNLYIIFSVKFIHLNSNILTNNNEVSFFGASIMRLRRICSCVVV